MNFINIVSFCLAVIYWAYIFFRQKNTLHKSDASQSKASDGDFGTKVFLILCLSVVTGGALAGIFTAFENNPIFAATCLIGLIGLLVFIAVKTKFVVTLVILVAAGGAITIGIITVPSIMLSTCSNGVSNQYEIPPYRK